MMNPEIESLMGLCEFLGAEHRQLALLGEGNVSQRLSEDMMLIKATGASLGAMREGDLVEARLSTLMALVENEDTGDDSRVQDALSDCLFRSDARRPSVEALLHAVILSLTDATTIAHTHPVSVNSLMCSTQADALVAGSLFPDQIVVLGRRQMLTPYVDPGLPLSRHVAIQLREFIREHGHAPKAIYLVNHGMFALACSVAEARAITQMADKTARVLIGALSVGGVSYLSDGQVDRIDTRPDELLRRRILAEDATVDLSTVAPNAR